MHGRRCTCTGRAATPGVGASYIGTGNYAGQVRVLVHTQRTGSTSFSTWGNLMKIVYDAP